MLSLAIVAAAFAVGCAQTTRVTQRIEGAVPGSGGPRYAVDASWHKPLPNDWIVGHWVHNIAIDSSDGVYTSEVDTGKRAQRFVRVP